MRECPDCGKQFSTGASYRVHKHRFHRVIPEQAQAVTQLEPPQEVELLEQSTPKEPETQQKDSSGGSGWLIGLGAVAAVIILALLGGRKQ